MSHAYVVKLSKVVKCSQAP